MIHHVVQDAPRPKLPLMGTVHTCTVPTLMQEYRSNVTLCAGLLRMSHSLENPCPLLPEADTD